MGTLFYGPVYHHPPLKTKSWRAYGCLWARKNTLRDKSWAWEWLTLLRRVVGIVQHPNKNRVYWVYLVWALFVFLYHDPPLMVGISVPQRSAVDVPLYTFVATYAILLYVFTPCSFPTTRVFEATSTAENDGYSY